MLIVSSGHHTYQDAIERDCQYRENGQDARTLQTREGDKEKNWHAS
jgi:hypothetical protein